MRRSCVHTCVQAELASRAAQTTVMSGGARLTGEAGGGQQRASPRQQQPPAPRPACCIPCVRPSPSSGEPPLPAITDISTSSL
ncbi:unnamed protein product [Euphydryas editha]|uniref:Uncharacterized protein n=1 Tax=Euphydryas editha TaxID=104508 RepID=A0AAU9V3S9_EUPED|nr:unnamed protein product [Euphydryas editha]